VEKPPANAGLTLRPRRYRNSPHAWAFRSTLRSRVACGRPAFIVAGRRSAFVVPPPALRGVGLIAEAGLPLFTGATRILALFIKAVGQFDRDQWFDFPNKKSVVDVEGSYLRTSMASCVAPACDGRGRGSRPRLWRASIQVVRCAHLRA
jgi:hypothetical protein